MKLTEKELEVMALFWASGNPLTAAEIVEASNNRSWSDKSIYIILNSLVAKKALVFAGTKPSGTNYAKAYEATIILEEYIALSINVIKKSLKIKLNINEDLLIKQFKKRKDD